MSSSKEKVLEWLNSSEAKAVKLEQEAKVPSMIEKSKSEYLEYFSGFEEKCPRHEAQFTWC